MSDFERLLEAALELTCLVAFGALLTGIAVLLLFN